MDANDALLNLSTIGFSGFGLLFLLAIVLSLSAYVKIVTVLGIVRAGIGVWGLPSAFVTGSLALMLSFFVMYPTVVSSLNAASKSVNQNRGLSQDQQRVVALEAGFAEWKQFLKKHTEPGELEDFSQVAAQLDKGHDEKVPTPAASIASTPANDSWRVVGPAFLASELKHAFATGLTLFLPLLIIDLVVANVLTAVGYVALNPVLVALPFKLLLFVLIDGWSLITTNLVSSYAG